MPKHSPLAASFVITALVALAAPFVAAAPAHAAGGATAGGADVQGSGSASTGSPNSGASYGYTFQVKNGGPSTADSVQISAPLPAGAGFTAATVNGAAGACTFVDPMVSCSLGSLAAGGQATVVVSASAPTTVGGYSTTATAASTTGDPNPANNAVTVGVQVKTPSVDTIKVSKCYINGGGEMLIKGASSDPTARLFAYRPDGTLIGEIQNGGGSRYGGTVMAYQPYDPVNVTIRSTSGGSITVPTTPFQI